MTNTEPDTVRTADSNTTLETAIIGAGVFVVVVMIVVVVVLSKKPGTVEERV
jgi:hypothetical protein